MLWDMVNYLYFDGQRQRMQAFKEQQPYIFWRCIGTVESHFMAWKSLLGITESSTDDEIAKACHDIDFLTSLINNGVAEPQREDDAYTVDFI